MFVGRFENNPGIQLCWNHGDWCAEAACKSAGVAKERGVAMAGRAMSEVGGHVRVWWDWQMPFAVFVFSASVAL